MVYILKNSENFYKIGYSKNPKNRVKQFNTANPYELKIIKTFETNFDSKIEAILKNHFKFRKISGEWFDLSDEDILKIESLIETYNKALLTTYNFNHRVDL